MKNILRLTLFTVLIISLDGFSNNNRVIKHLNNSLQIGFAGLNLHYKEDMSSLKKGLPPQASNSETGMINGVKFKWQKVLFAKIYTQVLLDYFRGNITYDGAFNNPPEYTPVSFNDKANIYDLGTTLGYIINSSSKLPAMPFVHIGYYNWNRHSVHEVYSTGLVAAGMKLNFSFFKQFEISPSIQVGSTIGANIDNETRNLSDVSLGAKLYFSTEIDAYYFVSRYFYINSFIQYAHFSFGKSAWHDIPNGRTAEPDSTTNIIKFGIGLGYTFE